MQPLRPRHEPAGLDHPLREALRLLEERPAPHPSAFPHWTPDCDVDENEDSLTIRLPVPGVGHEGVRVRLAGDLLTVEADRRLDGERRGRGLVRSFLLPHPVREDAVQAVLRKGTLTVTVDKRRRARRRRVPLS